MSTRLVLLFVMTSCLTGATDSTWENSPYFNTSALRDCDTTKKLLIERDNFLEINFLSSDDLKLNGLIRVKPNATINVILCAGFYPGRKEGMATMMHMLPDDCNILLFDARGHGTSEGSFLFNIHNYGKDEYKDVLGAIDLFSELNTLPIILHGVCSGSFHSARALIELEKKSDPRAQKINGIIFDSGFGSVTTMTSIPTLHVTTKTIPGILCATLYSSCSKREARDTWLCSILNTVASSILAVGQYFIGPRIQDNDPVVNIFESIHKITCPILFIHARNDSYVAIEQATRLAAQAQKPTTWWIDESEHALNQFKHKHTYREKVHAFLDLIIS